MNLLATALALILLLAPGAALVTPRARRVAAGLLGLGALVCAGLVLSGVGGEAELIVTHSFAAYVGADIVSKAFTVDTVVAPAWQWPALCFLWAAAWALWARRASIPAGSLRPLPGPLLLAWGGSALLLGLQKLAAPAPLSLGLDLPPVPPFELAVWPAAVAAAVRLAAYHKAVLVVLTQLSVFIALAHLPLAILGTLATQHEFGTYLDVHGIDHIANPFTRVSTPLEPGSTPQLAWLVWAPQLVMWPAFAMLSAGGVGFAAVMIPRQKTAHT